MVRWNCRDLSDWINCGCPNTDISNVTELSLYGYNTLTENINELTLFVNLVELNRSRIGRCGDELSVCPNEVLYLP